MADLTAGEVRQLLKEIEEGVYVLIKRSYR